MNMTTGIHAAARDHYLAKLVGGTLPQQVMGGDLDGLLYYPTHAFDEGVTYWLTRNGLVTPPDNGKNHLSAIGCRA